MATLAQLLDDIAQSPKGPKTAAIFDFDGTIISGYSATVFIREQIRRGDLSPRQLIELSTAMTSFGLGSLGFSAMMAVNSQFMRGIEEDTYEQVGEDLFRNKIARMVYPESRALIEAHIERGHTVAIISSATRYQVAPAARDLNIPHVLCTRLEVENGEFTGKVEHPTCFGQGKVDAAEALAQENGADLDQSFFYSDSTDDLLVLERVGFPRVLNPSSALTNIAKQYDWPAASFDSRGRPTLGQWARSIAATVSLVPSFVAGLPIYALTRSQREGRNFSFSLFADTASALIGLNLKVKGQEHLWSHRPAVFIFNHQSKADVVIMAKLLRRDIAGVGKQEIRKMPVIGKVLEMGGVVMIDRANASSAIEAMQPLVDAMRNDGVSVTLAPEGTRSISPKLMPFKKGAFHLAMQAGVPIVPIVIHNAGDVAPKGDFVFRPATVEVEVLPPIDTSDWTTHNLDHKVRYVRNEFLRVLGQPLEGEAGNAVESGKRSGARPASKSLRKSSPKAAARKTRTSTTKAKLKPEKAPAAKKRSKKAPAAARPRSARKKNDKA